MGPSRSRFPVEIDCLDGVFIQGVLGWRRCGAAFSVGLGVGPAAVVDGNYFPVRGGPLVGAGAKYAAQRSRQRREESAGSTGSFGGNCLGRTRAVLPVIPALGSFGPTLGGKDAGTPQTHLPYSHPINIFITRGFKAGLKARIVADIGQNIACAQVTGLEAIRPRNPRG